MATIIRKECPAEMMSGRAPQPVSFSFTDMRGQANDYLGTVRGEAAKIVQQAHQQAEQIRRQAEIAGRKAAEAAAERLLDEKIGKRMQTLLPALEQIVREINDAKTALLTHWEQSAVSVSTAIAERIVRRELANEPRITLDLIAESLRMATGMAEITLHVSPTDYEHLGPHIDALLHTLAQLTPSNIQANPNIGPGGCRIETRFGQIDNTIAAQLARIEHELT